MKSVAVQQAEGMVLCHDVTEIVRDQFKGRAFKKGHIIRQEDIPKLLEIGKEHIYVWEIDDNTLHENEAAMRIAHAAAGNGTWLNEPSEGKVELKSAAKGLLKIKADVLAEINDIEEIVFATIHSNQVVQTSSILAGCRVVPLVINADKISQVERICHNNFPIIEIKPLRSLKIGIVTTGSEVYNGRIKDEFGPVIKQKVEDLDCVVLRQIFVSDSIEMIVSAVHQLINEGAEMIITTGGMSVDPDDVTPAGIKATGGHIVTYGAPVLPGAMFMLAYINDIPVLGLPGCVMYYKSTVFDLILPRILAGENIIRKDITRLGHGGLCLNCKPCRYPACPFGKGI